MSQSLATVAAYLGAAILFILSLGGLCPTPKPRAGATCSAWSAWRWRAGHRVWPAREPLAWAWIVGALVIGGGIGLYAAKVVKMTQMPSWSR